MGFLSSFTHYAVTAVPRLESWSLLWGIEYLNETFQIIFLPLFYWYFGFSGTPCITDCVMAELEKLGQKYRVALRYMLCLMPWYYWSFGLYSHIVVMYMWKKQNYICILCLSILFASFLLHHVQSKFWLKKKTTLCILLLWNP